jgi:AGZA family xanthine/uracil permease-like MFS transporter
VPQATLQAEPDAVPLDPAATALLLIDDALGAAAFALAGAVLTFFGFMHGPEVGVAVTPSEALAYAVVGGFLVACARLEWVARPAPAPAVAPAE